MLPRCHLVVTLVVGAVVVETGDGSTDQHSVDEHPKKALVWSNNEKTRPENLSSHKKRQLAKVAASPLNVCVSKITSTVFVQFDPFKPETKPGQLCEPPCGRVCIAATSQM